ncbi:MAG: ATP-binding protein [Gammaproteobacteria bacterium]|nr:ATP-binding protein [Gammaproteobacteria bacterium]MYF01467.1 ATP-binding protein [Gammaproteobacteria bacterium]MYI76788.1 ATP-binding protein [Gammaproteobacteria bacterium]
MQLNVFDSIESQILRPERDLPYVFVGRHRELRGLENHFNVVSNRKHGSSGLVLVCGIPGIGKTQLIEKFAREKQASGEALWLRLHTEDLTDSRVLTLLRAALRLRQSGLRWTDVEVSVLGLKTNIARDQQCEDLTAGLDQLVQSKHKQPIIVTIDEVQNLQQSEADILRTFHTGTPDLPIMVVCAGLQNSYSVLQKHGLSRFGEVFEIDLLDQSDCSSAIEQMLDVWGCVVDGVDLGSVALKVQELASSTQGFPCHLQSHLSALKAVILERGKKFGSREDWNQVDKISKHKRNVYYSGRIEALGFPNAGVVMHRIAKLLNERTNGNFKTASSADITKILNLVEEDGMVDIDKGKALIRMIESGCLKVEEYSFYSIPIPSFQQYLLSRIDPFSKTLG